MSLVLRIAMLLTAVCDSQIIMTKKEIRKKEERINYCILIGICGDLICDASAGENCTSCFKDCGPCKIGERE